MSTKNRRKTAILLGVPAGFPEAPEGPWRLLLCQKHPKTSEIPKTTKVDEKLPKSRSRGLPPTPEGRARAPRVGRPPRPPRPELPGLRPSAADAGPGAPWTPPPATLSGDPTGWTRPPSAARRGGQAQTCPRRTNKSGQVFSHFRPPGALNGPRGRQKRPPAFWEYF